MNYLVISLLTILESAPLIIIFLYIFRENIKIPRFLEVVVILILQIVILLVAGRTIAAWSTNVFAKLAASVILVLIQWILIAELTNLTKSQSLFVVLIMHSFTDGIQLSVQMIYSGNVDMEQIMEWGYVGWVALFVVLYLPFYYYLLKNEFQPLVEITKEYTVWRYMCLLPIFVFVIYRVRISPDYFNQGYVWHPTMRALPYIWMIGIYIVFYFVLKSLRVTNEKNMIQQEMEVTAMMSDAYEKQYVALQERIKLDRRIRHDFRHSLLMVQKYAQEGKCDKILEQIQEYVEGTKENVEQSLCENTTLNTVLQHFIRLAEEEGIKVNAAVRVPQKVELTDTEFCVLVGNLMENALEACRRQESGERFIRVRIEKWEKQMLSIIIANSYTGKIKRDKGVYLSSKRNEAGIGLSSIAYIVDRHQGVMKVQDSEGVFTINILINC